MLNTTDKIIKHKVGLLNLAEEKACSLLGIQQMFTSFNNPKGNADTERLMRTTFPHMALG